MDFRTRTDDLDEAVLTAVEGRLSELHLSMPCSIVSRDLEKQTCVLQPLLKARIRKPDGTQEWKSYPQIQDVKMQWPAGGDVTMTFPVQPGDEVLAVFTTRSPDAWQQQGGEQQVMDARVHDLSNATALLGFKSDPKTLKGVSSISTQIRSRNSQQVVDVNPLTGTTVRSKGSTVTVQEAGVVLNAGDPYVV